MLGAAAAAGCGPAAAAPCRTSDPSGAVGHACSNRSRHAVLRQAPPRNPHADFVSLLDAALGARFGCRPDRQRAVARRLGAPPLPRPAGAHLQAILPMPSGSTARAARA